MKRSDSRRLFFILFCAFVKILLLGIPLREILASTASNRSAGGAQITTIGPAVSFTVTMWSTNRFTQSWTSVGLAGFFSSWSISFCRTVDVHRSWNARSQWNVVSEPKPGNGVNRFPKRLAFAGIPVLQWFSQSRTPSTLSVVPTSPIRI